MMLSIPSRGEPDTKDPGNERIRTGQTISDFLARNFEKQKNEKHFTFGFFFLEKKTQI